MYGVPSKEQDEATACPEKPEAHFHLVTKKPHPTFKLVSTLEESSYPNGLCGAVQKAAAEERTKKKRAHWRYVLQGKVIIVVRGWRGGPTNANV